MLFFKRILENVGFPVERVSKNRPFQSSKKPHFQSEAKYDAIDVKMIFNYDANKTHFRNKGFALSLVLKWPIWVQLSASLSR